MIHLGPSGALLIIAWLLMGTTAGALFGPTRTRRVLSALVVAGSLFVPFVGPPEESLARGLAGLGAMLMVMRWVEAVRASAPPVVPYAVLFVLPVDTPSLRRAPPRLAVDSLGRAASHGVLTALGIALVLAAPASAPSRFALRWLGGVVFVYGYVELAASSARLLLAALGVDVAQMQRDPILSRSVAEHWGERWNRVVSTWLRRHLFLPVTRRTRSPVAGLAAAFAWSAFLHAYFIYAAVGASAALAMGAYFVSQGLLVLLESRLPVARWPGPLARTWTILAVVGPSWLFVGPALAMFGVP